MEKKLHYKPIVSSPQNLLRREPSARRADEGTTSGDDRTKSSRHQGVVPEQTLQGQEEDHAVEDADATGEGGFLVIVSVVFSDEQMSTL